MAPPREGDLKSGVTGLLIGAVLLGAVLTAIVHMTNVKYEKEAPAAAETK